MRPLDDPTNPLGLENLRRSIVMLSPGQAARLDRESLLAVLEEIQRLQSDQKEVIGQLRAIVDRLEHPSNRR